MFYAGVGRKEGSDWQCNKQSYRPAKAQKTYMLSKDNRLSGRAAKYVSRRGHGVSGPALRVRWVPARGRVARATVVVPLYFDKRATRRNRTKRQIREILRPLMPRLRQPVNLMIYAGKGAGGRKFEELQGELISLLKRARLL